MSRPSVPVWMELVCGECAQQFPGQFVRRMDLGAGKAKAAMIDQALDEGWVRAHNEIFCCQAHANKYTERAARNAKVSQS